MGPWEQRCQGKGMTVESRGSFSKAGYGKASCFPREEAESLSHCTESTCFTPRDQRREAACPLTARAESQQRAALGVAEEGRVEPKPGTTVSRVPPCTLLFPSCIRSVPAAGGEAEQHVPAAPWDRHTRDREGQSPCGHARAALCLHRTHFGQRFPRFTTIHSYTGQGRNEGNRGWSQGDERQTSPDCPHAGWGLPALHAAFLPSSPSHKQ